jgi:hypothetical protein
MTAILAFVRGFKRLAALNPEFRAAITNQIAIRKPDILALPEERPPVLDTGLVGACSGQS